MRSQIKVFNELGIELFRSFLEEARQGNTEQFSGEILTSGHYTNISLPGIIVESADFALKADLISYISKKIQPIDPIQYYNKGLWTWLSAFYIETICPVRNEKRKVQEDAKYILNTEHYGRYYRHLIAAPVRLLNELGDLSKIYLAGSPDKHGDLMEQLASRQEIARCRGILEAAYVLYWDEQNNKIKRGARNKTGPGVLRRFAKDIIPQFQMTYDLNSMKGKEIVDLLPPEFDKWL
jgi:hypothetical protein